MAEAVAAMPPLPAPTWRRLRLIPAYDQDPAVVAFVQTTKGRVLLFGLMLLLAGGHPARVLILSLAAGAAYLPGARAPLILVATLATTLAGAVGEGDALLPAAAATAALFAFAAVLLLGARAVGRRGPFAHPVLWLSGLVIAAAGAASLPTLPGWATSLLWGVAGTLAASLWFLAYAIGNVTGRQARPLALHLGLLHPFWGSTTTPFGKGAAYLAKFEARDARELAVTQIKAAKLLLWADVLAVIQMLVTSLVHGRLGVPTLDLAVAALADGHPLSHLACLLALPASFTDNILSLAVMGHVFVAGSRYAGFRIPRNMCRPLEARTLADFWNRYYFYFKELLADFFFLPAFARLQRWPAKIRLLAATLCAAGFGNYLFHVLRDIDLVRSLGWRQALLGSQTYAFYCVVLAAGIGCSQLRKQRREPLPAWRRRSVPVQIIGFYCLTGVFAYDGRSLTLADHLRFFCYVWGLPT